MLKKYRILLLVGGMFSCLFSMSMIFESRIFFRNMYSEHFVYDFNVYSQIISIGLFGVLLLLIFIRKIKPYQITTVGVITVIINMTSMILYSSIVKEFYFNIYFLRGIILLLIGIFLQSKNFSYVKKLSLYFFLEFLILQVSFMSDDSIFYMANTSEPNMLGAIIVFSLGLSIPLSLNLFLTEGCVELPMQATQSININKLVKITSWISVGYLDVLIIMNLPLLFAILVDADGRTIFYYQMSALLRIALYILLIYSFICIIRESVKRWLFPVIAITIISNVIFPLTLNIQFYLERFYWLYGVTLDLGLLIILTVFVYIKKYKVALFLSLWFLLNFLLTPLQLGNVQGFVIFRHLSFGNIEIFVQIMYYFLPITLILVLYNQIKNQEVEN